MCILDRHVYVRASFYAGMLATVGALSYGIYGFQKGNQRIQQTMMRARVVAQGATVLVLVGGIALASMRNEEKK